MRLVTRSRVKVVQRDPTFDLMTIARRTGLSPRTLRYVVYHTLLPGVEQVGQGKGRLRAFTRPEAFGLAVAATLLEAGLKRGLVQDCMKPLVRTPPEASSTASPLDRIWGARDPVRIEVADRKYLRVRIEGPSPRDRSDSGWTDARGGAPPKADFDPTVVVSLNPTKLRDALAR